MGSIEEKQIKATRYYDRFSKTYDLFSPKWYYKKPREFAIKELNLSPNQKVLNIPCGTGQNFDEFQKYLLNSGKIIGIDISEGMLEKAKEKIKKNNWQNIQIFKENVTKVNMEWISEKLNSDLKFDAILLDLGLSGFPYWEKIIDDSISLLKPNGRIVIMDWYIDKPSLRGSFVKWIGKGEINRPLYQYLETKTREFKLNKSFKRGQMFVATGIRPDGNTSR